MATSLLVASALALPTAAHAWTQAHPAGLVTELAVDRDGGATVTMRIRWRVLAGRFRAFDFAELPQDFTLLEASGTDAQGTAVAVATRSPGPGRLEVTLGEEGGGLRRGNIDVVVRYTTSLRAQGAIRRVGSDAVVEFASVPWERGLEAAEFRVALPASVRRAQWLADDTPGVDTTVTSELGRDVVHALRRHLPAGNRWTARIACDAGLFPWLDGPHVTVQTARHAERRSLLPVVPGAAALGIGLAAIARTAQRRRRTNAAPIVTSPKLQWAGPALALAGGVLQVFGAAGVGGALVGGVALSLAGLGLTIPRIGRAPATPRERARVWTAAQVRAAMPEPGSLAARFGVALLSLVAFGTVAYALRAHDPWCALVGANAALLALLLAAVTRRTEPEGDGPQLASIERGLKPVIKRTTGARIAWRVRGDGRAPGAMALRVISRAGYRFARGVRAIECRLVWSARALRWQASPRLVVRVEGGSPLERTLRLAATRVGRIEQVPERGEVALVAELEGPGRRDAMRTLEAVLSEAIVPAPSPSAAARRAEHTLEESAEA